MTARSRKIFWGIIIASIHVKIAGLLLFPSCFGFAVLYFGVYDFGKEKGQVSPDSKHEKLLNITAGSLVIVSGLVEFLTVSQYMANVGIWRLLPFILEYAVFFRLLELYTSLSPSVSGLKRGYVIVMGTALSGFGLSLIFSVRVWQIFCGVVMLACRFMVLRAVYEDRKEEQQS